MDRTRRAYQKAQKVINVSEGAREALKNYTADAEYEENLMQAERVIMRERSQDCGGIDDPRPSKLRDAMKRLGLARVQDAKNGQQALVLDRAKAADGLAAINRRNKQAWEGRTYTDPKSGFKP